MEELKDRVIVQLSDAFRELQTSIKAPVKVSSQNSFVFQYEEKGIRQAIIQKLARQLSGLNASKHLLTAGYTQEMGVIFVSVRWTHLALRVGEKLRTVDTQHGSNSLIVLIQECEVNTICQQV